MSRLLCAEGANGDLFVSFGSFQAWRWRRFGCWEGDLPVLDGADLVRSGLVHLGQMVISRRISHHEM